MTSEKELPAKLVWPPQASKSLLREFTGLPVDYGFDAEGAWALVWTDGDTVSDDPVEVRPGDTVVRFEDGSVSVYATGEES